MILAAGLLVLLGLGLFIAGILTGVTVLYWACVAACVVAAGLLVAVRRRTAGTGRAAPPAAAVSPGEPRQPASTGGVAAAAQPAEAQPVGAAATEAAPEAVAGATSAAADAPRAADAPAAGDTPPAEEVPDPDVEEVEVTDLLIVVDLTEEVLVVDEHPRYHLAECGWLAGRETIRLPLDEARTDGFTPCAVCAPDRNLAERARAAKHSSG